MARSLKKGPYVEESLLKKVQKLNSENKITKYDECNIMTNFLVSAS